MKVVKTVYKRGNWVCSHCGSKTETVYVVTGHDHTDSSLDICGCGTGTSIEDAWNSNHYARECPDKYKDINNV